MYLYYSKNKENEQTQLLEMHSYAFVFDGIGCDDINLIINSEIKVQAIKSPAPFYLEPIQTL